MYIYKYIQSHLKQYKTSPCGHPHPPYMGPHGAFSCSVFKYCIYILLAQVLLSDLPAVLFFLLGESLPFNRLFAAAPYFLYFF